ncbi:MAG TPA: sigma-54-dependent Fis family transcriptional regulator [Microscillaceae bacterium]|jgi:DNA-binding NtrC family response regulator|nr:sigma-54-dependent Fis family transcriptional regulator [Microscillaceae bacterium]
MKEEEIQSIKLRFGIIGNSPALNHAIQIAAQVAPTDLNVLITGESGSGKESFSKIIHALSPRRHGNFIAVNCGAIPAGTIDSELYGHEKGAFTGAIEARKGFFEVTDGGTIFLDEIGEMPLETQTRLLRVLENGEFIKVGSTKVQKTNVRVVAATNVDLQEAISRRKFREDLYFRLSTVPIFVPPLRDRDKDILLLFRKFASDFSEKYRVAPISLTPEAAELVLKFRFPGNIRQLKNLVEQISAIETQREISAEKLATYLPSENRSHLPVALDENQQNQSFSERDLLYKILFDMRKDVTELKKLVFQLIQQGNFGTDVLQNHRDLFHSIGVDADGVDIQSTYTPKVILTKPANFADEKVIELNASADIVPTQDIVHEEETETLSLEEKEKELIIKALQKNRNKRKYAAQDLGISERTLYRKLKQYDIEE